MPEPYLAHLKKIVDRLGSLQIDEVELESKHFFSGTALFAKGPIKREYVALSDIAIEDRELFRELISLSVAYVFEITP